MKILKNHWIRLAISIIVTVLLVHVVINPFLTFARFYEERANFAFHSENENGVAVSRSLSRLNFYRSWSRNAIKIPLLSWGFRWLTDRYVFEDLALYQARQYYLIGDYDNVLLELANRIDAESTTLVGVAKYRILQIEYLEKVKVAPEDQKNDLKKTYINRIMDEAGRYFEQALRTDPDGRFEYKWNYDLGFDPEALEMAIEGNKAPRLLILGEGEGPAEDDTPRLDEKSTPGDSNSPRKS